MTQGISPWTRRDFLPPAPGGPSEGTPSASGLRRNAEVTHWPENETDPTAASGTGTVDAASGVHTLRDARDALTKQRLDSFRRSMTGVYHRPLVGDDLHWDALGDMHVAAPFTMARHFDDQAKTIVKNKDLVSRAAARAHLSPAVLIRVQEGRGTPSEICALTQSLIDAVSEQHPEMEWSPATIREWMFNCGIGIDCAGYAQQAYLAASGLTRSGARFASIAYESLSGLEQRGFRKLASVADVRAGDIVSLSSHERGEVGHRAIVYDQHVASASDMRALLAWGAGAQAFAVGGPIRVLQLDSSWGCGGSSHRGGVKRETFWHNESTGKWAHQAPSDRPFAASPDLYGEKLDGFFRGQGC
ncbi:MAG: hypothetical protein M3O36_11115 [Myxococcota bacterium]|nr:hypothetical protein [Myxococcota bacterium]